MKTKSRKIFFSLLLIAGLSLALVARADFIGQRINFSIDSTYDNQGRSEAIAVLLVSGNRSYFYIDESWWNGLDQTKQAEAKNFLEILAEEFDKKIYPTLTSAFGQEWRPGIDGDEKITLFFHPLKDDAGGYFSTGDEYPKAQNPPSNEREMIYLNTKRIGDPLLRSYLAHELVHLITFYQKDKLRGAAEDVWLNEARAEYAPTLLGYDIIYDNSNLKERVRQFVNNTFNSLTEWQGKPYDYGVANLFVQYLVDQYGSEAILQSLQSSKIGIPSLEETLAKLGFRDDFAAVFANWAIAVLVNDCNLGSRYCYLNPNLKNFRLVPLTNILPLTGQSQLSSTQATKAWAGNWYRFLGGKGYMVFDFASLTNADFRISYLIETKEKNIVLNSLNLDSQGRGKIEIPNFGTENTALTVIPVVIGKKTDFSEKEPVLQFSWRVAISESNPPGSETEALLAKISFLQKEIQRLKKELAKLQAGESVSCNVFARDLYYGMTNSLPVRCLQEFLKSKGQAVYPEGVVSGNYLSLTTLAVKRYQVQKGIRQTGYFGPLTRTAANAELIVNP